MVKNNKAMTITIELNGVPVIDREIIDTPQDPQSSIECESAENHGRTKWLVCVLLILAALIAGYIKGSVDGVKKGKDVYATQFEETAIDAAENFAAMAEECGWVADIDGDVEIDDYEGTFVDVRIEKRFKRETLRYDADVCVYPGSTTYEIGGKSYGLDEWREALMQYGEGRDYDGAMPEPKMIPEIQEPTPEPPHKDPVAKPDFQQPTP